MKYIFTLISLFATLCGLSQGAVQSGGNIKGTGNYPIVFSSDVKGGLHWTQSKANRDAIPTGFRVPGMVVYVQDSSKHYVLGNDLSTWGEWAGSSLSVTGAATSIISDNLTASRAVASDGSGKISVATTTLTELNRISGLSDNIMTLLGAKQATLVSGDNIKTVNGQTLIGSGNITISGGGGGSKIPVLDF